MGFKGHREHNSVLTIVATAIQPHAYKIMDNN